ncbi:hypoxanthine phosphoribosyltransferase [Chloroflexota bacterium]
MNPQESNRILFSKEEINAAVKRLASEIEKDYKGKNPLLLGILKGSFIFLADLVRLLDFPLEIEFVRLSSYGRGRTTAGKLNVVQGLRSRIRERDVLIVEDIVDTGQSVSFLMEYLSKKKPASLKLCVLTDKPSRRESTVNIDYLGFTVPDEFLIGYGLDFDEKFRNLPDIRIISKGE